MKTAAVAILFALGGGLCLLNFYLVVVREPLLKWLGRYDDRHVSIVPVIGQLFVTVGLIIGWNMTWAFWTGAALLLMDLGGIHLAVLTLLILLVWKGVDPH